MRGIIKNKWYVLVAWLVLVIGLLVAAPNMADLVREKGEITIPDQYSSTLAYDILAEANEENAVDETSVALVFYNKNQLTADEIKEAEKAIQTLAEHKKDLGITEILSHFTEKTLEEQLVADNGKAILASISIQWDGRGPSEISDQLYEVLKDSKVEHYFTSNWLINDDLMTSSQEGLKKTEGITVVFILIVLLLVFRSAISPIIPLVTVGLTYLAAQSIVAFLVDQFNFPISTYTQIFLVVILFGIGTDYCILLLSRYKEELSSRESVAEAIIETYRRGGRTVFFSGLAVMIGFAAIGFSEFIIYQSAAAVAIGVAVLLVALYTIVPFFMAALRMKLFWPSKSKPDHGDSKFWGFAGKIALRRPLIALTLVALVCLPFLITYDGKKSFESTDEISDDANSFKAFDIIAESFGPGESMPTKVVLKNDERLDTEEYIHLAEEISKEIDRVELVSTVRSVTRPTGDPIEEFFIAKQAETLEKGLGKGKEGLDEISKGLNEASSQLKKSEPDMKQAKNGIEELITGTKELQNGIGQIEFNLGKIETGIRQGSAGSDEIKKALAQARSGAFELQKGYQEILGGYEELQRNLGALAMNYQKITDGINQLSQGLSQANAAMYQYLENKYDHLAEDEQYLAMKGSITNIQSELSQVSGNLKQLNNGLGQINTGMRQANTGFEKAMGGQDSLASGLQQLIKGIEAQQKGLNQLADGQREILANIPKVTTGLSSVNKGQEQLLSGFASISDQLGQLTNGLNQSSEGLNEIAGGLGSAQDYLSDLSRSQSKGGFYLPKETIESKDFVEVLDVYMSPDRKVMTFDIIFETSPYANESMEQIAKIEDAVDRVTKGTKLENAVVAVGGITSVNADMNTMSEQDYSRTVWFMLVGVSIILIFLFRSIIIPIYVIGSLILTYYTSMGINEMIFVNGLGYPGINWSVPFFAFVILIALGVDYSIFLMDRFNEYKDSAIVDAMLLSMQKMGTVIISAAVILGGTFAAMMPSGMLTLLQIASCVIVGLFLYTVIVLPLFIPVMVKSFGAANWWPFKRATND